MRISPRRTLTSWHAAATAAAMNLIAIAAESSPLNVLIQKNPQNFPNQVGIVANVTKPPESQLQYLQ